MESGDQIQWREWGEEAFEEARRLDRPILLNIVASWCSFCRELDSTTLSDSAVIEKVSAGFVPIRVDKDRRPDINERYNAGGWPTLAFLTSQGELIAAETFLDVEELCLLLDRLVVLYRDHRGEIEEKLQEFHQKDETTTAAEEKTPLLSPQIVRNVAKTILDQFDPIYGGFGEGQKFPHAESIDFALLYFMRTGDGRMRDVVAYTLDHMIAGEIHDRVEGGFFRYATKRDWRVPHYEKMLDGNAAALRFLLESHQVFGKEEYKDAAMGILNWATNTLLDPETGAFFGSQDADPEYYGLDLSGRKHRGAPKVDRTIYTNWNALMVSCLYRAAAATENEEYRKMGLRTFNFLIEHLYERDRGMYHYWDGNYHIEGLLADQAYTIRAAIDTLQHTGDHRFLKLAEELFETVEKRQAAPEGGYFDIQRDPRAYGGLKKQNRSILENAVLAEALLRLYYFTRNDRYLAAARAAMEASAKDYKQYGYYVSGFARTVDLFFREPVLIVIVGNPANASTNELHRAALSRYLPARIVHLVDPKKNPEVFQRIQLPLTEKPTAYVSIGKVSFVETSDPRELPAIMEMADRDRK